MTDTVESLRAELEALTARDEKPGMRYIDFHSKALGVDLAAGFKIEADRTDDAGAFWAVEIHEVWFCSLELTKHLSPEALARVTAEAHERIGPELNTYEARRQAYRLTRTF